MNTQERDLISGLFDRLRSADNAPKDREAEQFIQQKVAAQPTAPYLMAQTVLVQEQALTNAQARIKELEGKLALASRSQTQDTGGSGGFLAGLFGGKPAAVTPPPQANTPPPMPPQQQQQPATGYALGSAPGYAAAPVPAATGGGSFLRTALGAAAGVAGGTLLYEGLENMLGHHGGMFGGSNMPMGGGFMETGYGGGRPTEVINNYYDNDDRRGEGSSGAGGGSDAISNPSDGGRGSGGGGGDYSTPPQDDVTNSNDNSNAPADNGGDYSTPPQDDPSDGGGSFLDSGDSSAGFTNTGDDTV